MEKQLSEKLPRIEVVDALRGFAVMAILLVHNLEHFIFPVYPTGDPGWLNILNDGVFNITFSLFAGKAYAIFALLFGFTFYIQSANQQRKGKDFGYRFLWRLVLLAVFATVNAAFFPAGDVLLLFVVVGVVLFVVRKWSDCAILVTAIVFLLQPVEWYHYVANLFNPAHIDVIPATQRTCFTFQCCPDLKMFSECCLIDSQYRCTFILLQIDQPVSFQNLKGFSDRCDRYAKFLSRILQCQDFSLCDLS